ncbi:hypothetical protein [Paracidovorax oryzae]|uniref:hypothetical protein n=1 Tax=Paracidovorax oryzae TaxID=862720 RepID=UPI0035CFA14B
MRQVFEKGLSYDIASKPIKLWIAPDLLLTVEQIFKQNYGLPFASKETSSATGFMEYEVTMGRDVTQEVFLRHLNTGKPGDYRDEMQRQLKLQAPSVLSRG